MTQSSEQKDTEVNHLTDEEIEARARAKARYYSNRPAYDPQNKRIMIGRYSPEGEVIKFKPVDKF